MSSCFFCGEEISEKISREHIFGDSFLGYMDLKLEQLTSSQPHPTSYSKLKVPSHKTCNTQEGSWFEQHVLSIIKSMDQNPEHLSGIHIPSDEPINQILRQTFTQWLAKLYFGLVYWEAGLKKHVDKARQEWLVSILNTNEFTYLRRCFKEGLDFKLPSSIFHFYVPDPPERVFRFDFGNGLPYGLFYIRFRNHLLVAALGDGNLVHEWFLNEHVRQCQAHINEQSQFDPVIYLHVVAHIWAVRECLPVQPIIEFNSSGIQDRSRESLAQRPNIDGDAVNKRAKEILDEHASKWKNGQCPTKP